jgi:Tol biopolymer transport system component
LAGVGPNRECTIWGTEDLQPISAPFTERIDADSIAWAPDSTAVAFGVEALLMGLVGDIFVYELADESIRNLTDDGVEGSFFSMDDTEPFPIDVMPAWTADSQALVFARSVREEGESIPTEIARIPRAGGDVEILMSIEERPFSIFTPMRVLADGSIVYTFAFSDVDDPLNGIWRLDLDGTTTMLVPGTAADLFPSPVILDIWTDSTELRMTGLSAPLAGILDDSRPWLFTWSSNTGQAEPIVSGDDRNPGRPLSARWSPDGGTLLVIGVQSEGQVTVETIGSARELTTLPESAGESSRGPRWIRPFWSARDTVFIPPIGGTAYLVTMAPIES